MKKTTTNTTHPPTAHLLTNYTREQRLVATFFISFLLNYHIMKQHGVGLIDGFGSFSTLLP
jgi:hypothetical protein